MVHNTNYVYDNHWNIKEILKVTNLENIKYFDFIVNRTKNINLIRDPANFTFHNYVSSLIMEKTYEENVPIYCVIINSDVVNLAIFIFEKGGCYPRPSKINNRED